MNNRPSPIVLFVYNRLQHTRMTVEALRKNELASENELFIFSDGPRTESDREKVLELRSYLRTVTGFRTITLIEREENRGLAKSIISGVTEIVNRFGRIIVLEDDLMTSPYFLRYMNEALDLYQDDDRVISIHGYIYPVTTTLPETFFLRGADCWGWATWKRGWDLFESDGKKLLDELKTRKLTREFDFNGSYGYTRMLRHQIAGKNDSWAIRWYASAFLKNRLTLYPGHSLVRNIGMDSSGTHSRTTDAFSVAPAETRVVVDRIPIEENAAARAAFEHFFRHAGSPLSNLLSAVRAKLSGLMRTKER